MNTFKRVYQGGHHDVWCDGKNHRKCAGGYVWPDNPAPKEPYREFKCDCGKWANNAAFAVKRDFSIPVEDF